MHHKVIFMQEYPVQECLKEKGTRSEVGCQAFLRKEIIKNESAASLKTYFSLDDHDTVVHIIDEATENCYFEHLANKFSKEFTNKFTNFDEFRKWAMENHLPYCTKDFVVKSTMTLYGDPNYLQIEIMGNVKSNEEVENIILQARNRTKTEVVSVVGRRDTGQNNSLTGLSEGMGLYLMNKLVVLLNGTWDFVPDKNGWSGFRIKLPL